MQVIVVNELLSGGWLEFLGNVRLRDDEKFSAQRAIDRCEVSAVEEIVTSEVDARLREGARAANAPLDAAALSALRADVTRATETGVALGAAVDDVVRGWGAEVEHVSRAIERAARDLGADLSAPVTATAIATASGADDDEGAGAGAGADSGGAAGDSGGGGGGGDSSAAEMVTLLDGMALTVALALRKGEAVRLELAAEEAVRRHQAKQRDARLDAEILAQHAASQAAEAEPSPFEIRDDLASVREAAVQALARGATVEAAATQARAEWATMLGEVLREYEGAAGRRRWRPTLRSSTRTASGGGCWSPSCATCGGEPVARAVQVVLKRKGEEIMARRAAAALDGMLGEAPRTLFSRAAAATPLEPEGREVLVATLCKHVPPGQPSISRSLLVAVLKVWRELVRAAGHALEQRARERGLLFEAAGDSSLDALAASIGATRWRAVLQSGHWVGVIDDEACRAVLPSAAAAATGARHGAVFTHAGAGGAAGGDEASEDEAPMVETRNANRRRWWERVHGARGRWATTTTTTTMTRRTRRRCSRRWMSRRRRFRPPRRRLRACRRSTTSPRRRWRPSSASSS